MKTRTRKLPVVEIATTAAETMTALDALRSAWSDDQNHTVIVNKAKAGVDTAIANKRGSRRDTYTKLAKLSADNAWSWDDCGKAADELVATGNNDAQQRTIRAFTNACLTAMHPNVRGRWDELVTHSNEVFEFEDAAELLGKQDHYIQKIAGEMKKNANIALGEPETILANAETLVGSSKFKAAKAMKVLKRALKTLGEVLEIAPNQTVKDSITKLATLEKGNFTVGVQAAPKEKIELPPTSSSPKTKSAPKTKDATPATDATPDATPANTGAAFDDASLDALLNNPLLQRKLAAMLLAK